MQHVDSKELTELLQNNNCLLLDIRDLQSYKEGHIIGAKHLDVNTVLKEELLSIKKESVDKPLVVYCYRGNSSQRFIKYFGLESDPLVYNLTGGFEGYKDSYPSHIKIS